MGVGDNIRLIRKERGLTQKQLGKLCGIAEPNIRKYENEKQKPKLETLEKIASALGVTAFELMGTEYWDRKYPHLAKESKEYEGFIDYLNSLGYIVRDFISTPSQIPIEDFEKAGKMDLVPEECLQSGFVEGESFLAELIKDGKSIILTQGEFEDLQKSAKEVIAFKLWQKSHEKK